VFGGKRQSEDTIAAMRAIAAGTQAAYAFRCLVRRPDIGVQRLAVTLRPVLGAERRAVRILFEVAALASAPLEPVSPLSPRECEVLQLTADGGTATSIAKQLFLSPGTVRTHQRNIFAKLRVHDRAAAVAEGMRRGLID
jgi:DNA-binding CsgD family transcriptional regulator